MEKEKKENQLTEYEKYCQMMAQQQEDEIDELISGDMNEEAPEGVFVRGHQWKVKSGKLFAIKQVNIQFSLFNFQFSKIFNSKRNEQSEERSNGMGGA